MQKTTEQFTLLPKCLCSDTSQKELYFPRHEIKSFWPVSLFYVDALPINSLYIWLYPVKNSDIQVCILPFQTIFDGLKWIFLYHFAYKHRVKN